MEALCAIVDVNNRPFKGVKLSIQMVHYSITSAPPPSSAGQVSLVVAPGQVTFAQVVHRPVWTDNSNDGKSIIVGEKND